MNEELKQLALEAGCHLGQYGDICVFSSHTATTCIEDELEKFAKLVADKEREECVRRAHIALLGTLESTAARVIHAIRARVKA